MAHAYSQGTTSVNWSEALDSLRSHRGWIAGLGILMIIGGAAAAYYAVATTYLSINTLGILLIVAAFLHIGEGIASRHWSVFLIQSLVAVLYIITGALILGRPMLVAEALTLMMAAFFMANGLIKIVTAFVVQMPQWGSWVLNGVVTMILGIMVFNQWPASGLWVIGFFIGMDLMMNGAALVYLSSVIRRLGNTVGNIAS